MPSKHLSDRLKGTVASVRDSAEAVMNDPRAAKPVKHAKRGASAAAKRLDSTRRKVTQEEAWSECTDAIEEIVDVLIVQSRLIEALSEKVEALEEQARGLDRA